MTSEELGEMFEGDSADMCGKKNLLVSIGGQAEGLMCADPGARTPSALAEIVTQMHKTVETVEDMKIIQR